MKETFPQLSFEVKADGLVLLTQRQDHEDVSIDVHPQQLAHIGRALFGGRNAASKRVDELERRLAVLAEKIDDFAGDKFFRGEIIERCGCGDVMLAQLDALRDLAWEFDGGLVPRHLLDTDEDGKAASNDPA